MSAPKGKPIEPRAPAAPTQAEALARDHSARIPNFRREGEPVLKPSVFTSQGLQEPGTNQTAEPTRVMNRKGAKESHGY